MSPPVVQSHGKPYVEPERHDELSAGVAAPQVNAGDERRDDGTIAQGASKVPSLGGKARKGRTVLSHVITGSKLSPSSMKRAQNLRRVLASEIARTVGGGVCDVASSLLVKFSAQKTAAAEEAFAEGDYDMHRKLSESARMDLIYARELAAKAAASRPKAPFDPLAAWREPKDGDQ